jgi:hypothetical protein
MLQNTSQIAPRTPPGATPSPRLSNALPNDPQKSPNGPQTPPKWSQNGAQMGAKINVKTYIDFILILRAKKEPKCLQNHKKSTKC